MTRFRGEHISGLWLLFLFDLLASRSLAGPPLSFLIGVPIRPWSWILHEHRKELREKIAQQNWVPPQSVKGCDRNNRIDCREDEQ
jgi:hypothetical protein